MYITRIRVSSHPFPIEVQRYNRNKKKREERKCDICNTNSIGDEEHYLLKCQNAEMEHIRDNFIKNIKEKIPQLENFSNSNIIDYCMTLSDERIHVPIGTYIKQIITTYKEETEGKLDTEKPPIKTRIGRLVKKPSKLNL